MVARPLRGTNAVLLTSAAVILLSTACQRSRGVTRKAQVYFDDVAKEYITPPCLANSPELSGRFGTLGTFAEVWKDYPVPTRHGYKLEAGCQNQSADTIFEPFATWPLPLPEPRVDTVTGVWRY